MENDPNVHYALVDPHNAALTRTEGSIRLEMWEGVSSERFRRCEVWLIAQTSAPLNEAVRDPVATFHRVFICVESRYQIMVFMISHTCTGGRWRSHGFFFAVWG